MGKGGGGGGPAPAPSSQTVTQTAIPEYARPYVETMLGQSQALTNINQNPYQTYGGQRIAEFNPTQQNAFQEAINRQSAGQLAPATGLATASGMGSLGIAGQMAGAGQQYANQATNAASQQAYMSPYIQNALQPQLAEMQRQYDITGLQQRRAAVGAGAFGGNREALMRAENERNKNMAMNQAIGSGYQNAFQAAQQAQQFGANLGLQGFQGALSGLGQAGQAASTLGQLGQTQFGQESALNAERQKIGAVQQAQAQQGLDLGYQDFLKQKNYPYQQLAFMSDMLRGLPLSQSAQQVYTAPPSMGSQLGGLGMSALGIYGASGGFRAKGGMVGKGYAEGGKVGYATGGDIKMMKTEQLQQLLENPGLTPLESDMVEKELMLRRRMEMNPETDQIMAGITAIPTGEMVPEGMAGGGIVAFAEGGDTERKAFQKLLEQQVRKDLEDQANAKPFTRSEQQMAGIESEMKARREQAPYLALTAAGLGTLAGTSQYGLTNLGLGGIEGMKSYARSKADQDLSSRQLLQQQVEAEKAELARRSGLQSARTTALTQSYNKDADIERSKIAKAQLGQGRDTQNILNATRIFENAVKAEKTNLFQQNKARFNMDYTSAELDAEATANVMKRLTPGIKNILFPEGSLAPTAPAVPAPAAPAAGGKTFNVIVNGKTFSFPNKEAADTFKKRAKESDPKATIQ